MPERGGTVGEKEREKRRLKHVREREFGLVKWPSQFSTYLQKDAQ